MIHRFGRVLDCNALFFTFHTLHELLSILVLTCHDVTNAEVGKHNSGNGQEVFHLTTDEGLVVSDGISVSFTLHEEYVSNVQFPSLMLGAEFSALFKYLLDCGVVGLVPVEFGLHHQNRNVVVKGGVVVLECRVNGLGVTGKSCILDGLCSFS